MYLLTTPLVILFLIYSAQGQNDFGYNVIDKFLDSPDVTPYGHSISKFKTLFVQMQHILDRVTGSKTNQNIEHVKLPEPMAHKPSEKQSRPEMNSRKVTTPINMRQPAQDTPISTTRIHINHTQENITQGLRNTQIDNIISEYGAMDSKGDFSEISGIPDVDYPIYSTIPNTTFRCENHEYPGYYADPEGRCQVFHICINNHKFDFLCPNGTIFSQAHLVCVWWNQFDCSSATSLYEINANLFKAMLDQTQSQTETNPMKTNLSSSTTTVQEHSSTTKSPLNQYSPLSATEMSKNQHIYNQHISNNQNKIVGSNFHRSPSVIQPHQLSSILIRNNVGVQKSTDPENYDGFYSQHKMQIGYKKDFQKFKNKGQPSSESKTVENDTSVNSRRQKGAPTVKSKGKKRKFRIYLP